MEKASSRFLTQEERRELLRQHKPSLNGRRKDRLKFLLLKDEGWSYEQIARALFLDDQTLRNYWLEYQKGLNSLLTFKYQGRPSKLSWTECQELKQHLSDYTYHTASQITAYIKEQYGRIYSRQGVIVLLSKMGFRYSRIKMVPGHPDAQRQQVFIEQYEALKSSLSEGEEILFLDAVHPTHNVKTGYGWVLKGLVKQVASNTGRLRVNINGAYNPRTREVIFLEEETINAKATARLILAILAKYPTQKIHLILDNAPYHRAKIMQLFAHHSRINLIYLPPYCPNLNLIERLWKFMYKKVTLFRRYNRFSEFRAAITDFLQHLPKHDQELASLMTERFRIIQPHCSNFILP